MAWVHRFHLGDRPAAGSGSLDVERGSSILSRLIGAILRFPRAGQDQPVEVRITAERGTDHWHRRIGGRSLDSSQRRTGDIVTEYAGPTELRMRLDVTADGIALTPLGGSLRIGPFRIPLPEALAPHTCATATATASDGFEVTARIWVPSIGLLVAYRGRVHEEGAADG
ncbi:MAG: hypothetical protein JWO79_3247 [Actinomycetia bacterium]|jgi:hypothetical protein|nr:hypothetical protein [Actinomycetes bacterium]MDQ1652210.1 hypothetical protein [Cryptosporangiaceae bacterium]MDQ1658823.1 hypothetical protein [Cryptosporangiaceae bacterium]